LTSHFTHITHHITHHTSHITHHTSHHTHHTSHYILYFNLTYPSSTPTPLLGFVIKLRKKIPSSLSDTRQEYIFFFRLYKIYIIKLN
jgi:hypothetical protein